jgi:hypothetical protein
VHGCRRLLASSGSSLLLTSLAGADAIAFDTFSQVFSIAILDGVISAVTPERGWMNETTGTLFGCILLALHSVCQLPVLLRLSCRSDLR